MNRSRFVSSVSPILLTGLPLVALAFYPSHEATPMSMNTAPNQSASPTPSPVPSPTSHVTVNGQPVELEAGGTATVLSPSGETKITSADGTTTVTTSSGGRSTTPTGSGNLNVSVQSQGNGGTSWQSTQVGSFSGGSNWSSNSSSTMVTGNGQSTIHIEQP